MASPEELVDALPIDTYWNAGSIADINVPYVLTACDDNPWQEVIIVGIRHFQDIDDQQYPAVRSLWNRYLTSCHERGTEHAVVINEGGVRPFYPTETPEAALQRDGEQSLMVNLACSEGIDVVGGELPQTQQIDKLLERYAPEETSYYFYMRMACQFLNTRLAGQMNGVNFHDYVMERATIRDITTSPKLNFSIDDLHQVHKSEYPDIPFDPSEPMPDGTHRTPYDLEAMCFPYSLDCLRDGRLSLLHDISLYFNKLRAKHFLKLVVDYWDTGSNVFFMPGAAHAVMLERVLPHALVSNVTRHAGLLACQKYIERSFR